MRLFEIDKPSLAEGTLEAPDHAPLKIEGVHLFAQTEGLWNPRQAD